MRIKQSFCYPLFLDTEKPDVNELFQRAAATGYKAAELWKRPDDFEEIVATAHKHGLVVASMLGHGTLPDGLNNPENHDRIEAELIESIDIAVKNQVPGLIAFSGNRLDGQSDYEGAIECAKGLRRVSAYAEKNNVNINMELLNSKVNHLGYQCDHSDWGAAMCEMVNSPRVKLLFDIYHMQIMEGDIIHNIQKILPYIGHFHTAGNPGRNDMNDTQEINYVGICKAIAATDYDLYLGHEFFTKGDRTDALQEAFDICNQG